MSRRRRRPLRAALAALVLVALGACTSGPPSGGGGATSPSGGGGTISPAATTFTNPVLGQGADPFLAVVDRTYYYVQSTRDGTGVSLRSSRSLATLADAPEQVVFRGGTGGSPCCEWWAPELHRIGARWYIYVAADDGDNDHHRSYVLAADRVTGPYSFAGRLQLPGDRWAIDATVFAVAGRRYVAWSGWPGRRNGQQDLYLAALAAPTRARGRAVLVSAPTLAWETEAGSVGVKVNEGPAALVRGGKVYLSYSASGCWTPAYALGLLTADASADLLSARSWTKSPRPVFSGGSGEYGTGHNSFFPSPDGSQTWFAYHAVDTAAGSCGSDREVYVQPLAFAPDGTPQFGRPSGEDTPLPLPAGDPGR